MRTGQPVTTTQTGSPQPQGQGRNASGANPGGAKGGRGAENNRAARTKPAAPLAAIVKDDAEQARKAAEEAEANRGKRWTLVENGQKTAMTRDEKVQFEKEKEERRKLLEKTEEDDLF